MVKESLSYSPEQGFFGADPEKSRIHGTKTCTVEDYKAFESEIHKRLPDYATIQWQKELKTLGHIALESGFSTGVTLLVRDVMLSMGYSSRAARWGSYAASQSFNLYRVMRSLYEGASFLSSLLPMALSSLTYHGLIQSGLASDTTATHCSTVVSVGTSLYTGDGFFKTVTHLSASAFVSKLTEMGEKAFADQFLVTKLKEKLVRFREDYEALLEQCTDEEQDNLTGQLEPLLIKMERSPCMEHYAQLEALQQKVSKLLISQPEDLVKTNPNEVYGDLQQTLTSAI